MTNLAEPTVENLQKASDHFLHLTATAVGGSAVHLRDEHGIEPGPAAIERARQHGEAHGVPNVPDAALHRYMAAERAQRRGGSMSTDGEGTNDAAV